MTVRDSLPWIAAVLIAATIGAGLADQRLRYEPRTQLRIWLYRIRRRLERWIRHRL